MSLVIWWWCGGDDVFWAMINVLIIVM